MILGRGGFGDVYLAMHIESRLDRAVKTVFADTAQSAIRVEKEIQVLKGLNHPNIAPFVDSDRDLAEQHIFYVVLEYFSRGDLNRYLRDEKRTPREVPANLMLCWFRQLALAVAVSYPHIIRIRTHLCHCSKIDIPTALSSRPALSRQTGLHYFSVPGYADEQAV